MYILLDFNVKLFFPSHLCINRSLLCPSLMYGSPCDSLLILCIFLGWPHPCLGFSFFFKKKKEISFLFKNWNIVDIQYSVTFRHTTSWYDICIHYEMMTTLCLVTISPHMKLLQYYWSYSLHCIFTSPWPIFPTFLSWAENVLPISALDVTQKP